MSQVGQVSGGGQMSYIASAAAAADRRRRIPWTLHSGAEGRR